MEYTKQQKQQWGQIILDYQQQRVMEMQADAYHQQRQRLENESIRICRTEQRQLQRQIIRVQGLQILFFHKTQDCIQANLLTEEQAGFRQNRSTTYQLTKLTQQIKRAFNQQVFWQFL